jgi:hypothetical protein
VVFLSFCFAVVVGKRWRVVSCRVVSKRVVCEKESRKWCEVLLARVSASAMADSVRREVEWCNDCWWSQSGKVKCCRSSEVKGLGQLARVCTIFTRILAR